MLHRNSSAGTAAQKSSKCSLIQRPAIILAMLLLCAVFVRAQGKWQIANEGTKPFYANVNDRGSVCDSVSDIAPPNTHYCIYIKYMFNDTINHPVYSCGHKGSYSHRRKGYKKNGKYDLDWQCEEFGHNYCDVCNKKINVYYYPKDSLVYDGENY